VIAPGISINNGNRQIINEENTKTIQFRPIVTWSPGLAFIELFAIISRC